MSLTTPLHSIRNGSPRGGAALIALAAVCAWTGTAAADGHAMPRTPSNEGARVYIVSPADVESTAKLIKTSRHAIPLKRGNSSSSLSSLRT